MTTARSPFTEETLEYSVDEFPFLQQIYRTLFGDSLAKTSSLGEQLKSLSSSNGHFAVGRGKNRSIDESIYHRFLRDFIRPHLGDDLLLFERYANLRTHVRGSRALTGPHKDADYKHSPYEINFWRMTPVFGNASLWAESSPGLGDYHPFVGSYGTAVRFYGNQCMHFTKDNDTDHTRFSFDFRVIRLRDFERCGIGVPGRESDSPWVLFRYYGIMGPDGALSESDWGATAMRARMLLGASEWTLVREDFFEGVVKRFEARYGFGFIACAEIEAEYHQEVFLHKSLAADFVVGDRVSFQVYTNKEGKCRAVDLQAGGAQERETAAGLEQGGRDCVGSSMRSCEVPAADHQSRQTP
ncbi:unnamed protein product [Prorocentrum cordatum]|uniref:CSD domain-containing protein n=1 Tax=Prorocentrum cordatum TaxID=2364126 RepID=A0ABN9XNK6_9DINO|nr:unnamed protein product [Polarella glacialis]